MGKVLAQEEPCPVCAATIMLSPCRNSSSATVMAISQHRIDQTVLAAEMGVQGALGGTHLLMFAYPQSPFAQPRNVVGGHFIASLTGLVFMAIFGAHWWSMALAVGSAVALMLVFRMPHPPAGSNPLIVMLGGAGWSFLLTPTLIGSLIIVLVALLYNNLSHPRRYPTYWW